MLRALMKRTNAEFVGTFARVFAGTGAVVIGISGSKTKVS
jgi:glycerol uptake facilitator-like aquaporin